MFYHFKNIPLRINNRDILASDLQLNQDIELVSPYKDNEISNTNYISKSPFVGSLRFRYYLTGTDYLKEYIYTDESDVITGYIGGITFNQGYLSNYSIVCNPNSPVEADAEIVFFDKLSGSFSPSAPIAVNQRALNLYNAIIDTTGYSTNPLESINQINFNYSCQLIPSYKSYDVGYFPNQADRVSLQEKTIECEITSDNINMDIPISGDNFGLNITFYQPLNSSAYESFSVSGKISSKSFRISNNDVHSHSLKVTQKHLSVNGEISGVVTGNGFFTIKSTNGTHPFISPNQKLYVNKIFVGDVNCPDFIVTRNSNYDSILVTTPADVINDYVHIEGKSKYFTSPSAVNFDYSPIDITSISPNSGSAGSSIGLFGTNFYQITNVKFGDIPANFQVLNPTIIQVVVPYNVITDRIRVISSKRNLTGISSGNFYGEPIINSIFPVTGVWKNPIIINGINLSGTTGVKFNGANASGYIINSNIQITANSPDIQEGFAKGYVTVFNSGGTAKSISIYQPHVPIYNFLPLSGVYLETVKLNTKINTGYLFPTGGGYKVKFGNVDTVFYISGADYSSPYGTGNRTGVINITTNFSLAERTGLINGFYDDNLSYLSGPESILGRNIKFEFSIPQVIQELKWYQDSANIQGEGITGSWKIFGSNNDSTWNQLTNITRIGVSATTTISMANNYDYYKYYVISGVATGNTNPAPWIREVEFKVLTTGCLTGQIPIGSIDDYIYLYQPDGITTYSPNTGKFNVISEPEIFSFSPSIINQYKYFTPTIGGKNFKFFFDKPYFFALSGEESHNNGYIQYYSNISSNSGSSADFAQIPNIIITGATGLYTAIVQNKAGIAKFTGALFVKSGINQSKNCIMSSNDSSNIYQAYPERYAIDGSINSIGVISASTTLGQYAFTINPKNNGLIDVSIIKFIFENAPAISSRVPNQSGQIKLYYRNAGSPVYDGSQVTLSGLIFNQNSATFTGIRTIKVMSPKIITNNTHYLGINEIEIY